MQRPRSFRPVFEKIEVDEHNVIFGKCDIYSNKKMVLNENDKIEYTTDAQSDNSNDVNIYIIDMLRELAEFAGQAGMNNLKLRIQDVLPGDVTAQEDLDAISRRHNQS